MPKRMGLGWAGAALLLALGTAAPAEPPSIPPVDSPALAALGTHNVGVEVLQLSYSDPAGRARPLRVVLWYPSKAGARGAAPPSYVREFVAKPGSPPIRAEFEALARPKASIAGGRFPLVIVSHGYRGWPELMSFLTENLASKGYIVAGIDHSDEAFSDSAGFARSFAIAAATRARDQQFVMAELVRRAGAGKGSVAGAIDAQRIGLIGYSMGGFGALATAGAGYDTASPIHKSLPARALSDQTGSRSAGAGLRAVVAFAPWGAQPPHRAWSPATLAGLETPLLLVSGDHDDVSGYKDGVRWLFEHSDRADRHFLIYRNARHNTAGNPAPRGIPADFATREYFDEPVWRSDRLNAINQHFVTAFLDRHLRNDVSRAAFLRAPDAGSSWPGFQPRWGLGFDLESAPATR